MDGIHQRKDKSVFLLKYLLLLMIFIGTAFALLFLYAYPGILFLKPLPEWFNPFERIGYYLMFTSLFCIYITTYLLYKKKSSFRNYMIASFILPIFGIFFFKEDIGLTIIIGYSIIGVLILFSLSRSKAVEEYLENN